eukprot:gene5803-7292_t
MSESLRGLWASLSETKVRHVPGWAARNITPGRLGTIGSGLSTQYARKYFHKGKGTPVAHVMIALGLIGYAVEYSHLKGQDGGDAAGGGGGGVVC